MQLKIASNTFIDNPSLTKAPSEGTVLNSSMKYFDKDGYELNQTEQVYHIENGVDLSEQHLYHTANHKSWFYDEDISEVGFILDHSMLMQRWDYQGLAREQIKRLLEKRPLLGKLLSIRQKWGLDFSLDYVDPDGWTVEIFHLENDFLTLDTAIDAKNRAEDLILKTDWENVLDQIIERKSEWENLCSDDQADWKAHLVGWHRAFDNQKVFF